jgi:uncharacterized protein (TIGR00266 family)
MRILSSQGRNYRAKGSDIQVVEIELKEGEEVVAEAGNLFYMNSSIRMEAKVDGEGVLGVIGNILKRKIAGESAFLTSFTGNGVVAFSSERIGKIVPILLEGDSIYAQRDAFLCGAGDISVDVALQKRLSSGFFGGEGFILERISGEGVVFLNATGYLEVKELQRETILVETAKAVAWSKGIDYEIEVIRDIKTAIFGDEGLFLTKLSGSGIVILQSVDFETFRRKLIGRTKDE